MPRRRKTLVEVRDDLNRLICTHLGQFKKPKQIQQAVWAKYHVPCEPTQIARIAASPDWQPMIQMARVEYLANLLEVPIANKKIRLERLEDNYQTAMTLQALPEARLQLMAAREEMEEAKAAQTNIYIHQQIAHLDTATLERRRQEIVERLKDLGEVHALSQA